jgi:hypothetical protein
LGDDSGTRRAHTRRAPRGHLAAAGKLQLEGLFRYRRGFVEVLDRSGLEAHTSARYGVFRKQFDRLLSRVHSLHVGWHIAQLFTNHLLVRETLAMCASVQMAERIRVTMDTGIQFSPPDGYPQ